MTIRGRYFTDKEVEFITQVVSNNSSLSRRKLSITICEKLDWRQLNGRLKDRACRDVLLKLNVQGIVKLPDALERGDNRKLRIRSVNFVEPTMPIRLTQNRRILRGSYVFSRLRKRPCRSAIPLWWQSSTHYRKLPLARIVG